VSTVLSVSVLNDNNNKVEEVSIFQKFLNSLPQIQFDLFNELLLDHGANLLSLEAFLTLIFDIQILASENAEISFEDSKNELLFYSMLLLTSCLFNKSFDAISLNGANSSENLVEEIKNLFVDSKMKQKRLDWFKHLLLIEDRNSLSKKSLFKKEACAWIFRICLLEQDRNHFDENNSIKFSLLESFLIEILSLLTLAINSEQKVICCKDYFLLATNLISNLDHNLKNEKLCMKELMKFIEKELRQRDFNEIHNVNGSITEDDVLIGLFNLAIAILRLEIKHINMNKPIVSKQSFSFIDELYDYLFKLNVCNESVLCLNQKKIQLPKCRSPQSRSLCFELLIELCRSNLENYAYLNNKLILLHKTPQTVIFHYFQILKIIFMNQNPRYFSTSDFEHLLNMNF
jgi:hypothetical protein